CVLARLLYSAAYRKSPALKDHAGIVDVIGVEGETIERGQRGIAESACQVALAEQQSGGPVAELQSFFQQRLLPAVYGKSAERQNGRQLQQFAAVDLLELLFVNFGFADLHRPGDSPVATVGEACTWDSQLITKVSQRDEYIPGTLGMAQECHIPRFCWPWRGFQGILIGGRFVSMLEPQTLVPKKERALETAAAPRSSNDPKQRQLMVIALAVLLVALGFVLYRDREFWFPDTDEADSDQAVPSAPVATAPTAITPVQADPLTAKA